MGLLCAAVAKSSGYGTIVMADIIQNRLDFALSNGFADQVVKLPTRRAKDTEQGLAFAKEDAMNLRKENDGRTFSRVFECTGVEACVRTSIYVSTSLSKPVSLSQVQLLTRWDGQATRNGGKVLLVGMGTPIQTLPISAAALREVDLVGIWRYADCYPRGIELMQRAGKGGVPDVRKLITHHFRGLDQSLEAFDMAAKTCDPNGNLVIKVVVENEQ